ncbi:MAG: hypothetical protein JSV58_05370 [Candidatus Bathyarchaeota archaeon]|nr:MAG: hypothetical protein JSV58_05370 [Candidatus Bathyarchaeota archaeon]
MSNEAKIALLQLRIREANRDKWIAYVLGCASLLPIALLYQSYDVPYEMVFLIGLPFFIGGIGTGQYYRYQKHRLMKKLERMTKGYTECPKCRKEIPSGDYKYCPLCSASLES